MDNLSKPTEPTARQNGVYVLGIIVSSRARVIKRKDGSGISVAVEHEIALQPGVATWVQWLDPKTDARVKVAGETVTEFPRLKDFEAVTIRAERLKYDEHKGQIVIQSGEVIAQL